MGRASLYRKGRQVQSAGYPAVCRCSAAIAISHALWDAIAAALCAFGAKAHGRQKADKTIKPQWKKSELFTKFGLTPEMVRTPRCHRLKHKQPAEIRRTMQGFPKLWREVKQAEDEWKNLKQKVDAVAGAGTMVMPTKLKAAAKKCFETWLDEWCMSDMRIVENVTVNHQILNETMIVGRFRAHPDDARDDG